MSFSKQAKKEISKQAINAPCCVTAAAYGIACFGRYFDAKGLVLKTENVFIAQWAKAVYKQAGIVGRVYVKGDEEKRSYEFAVKDPFEVEKMLAAFGHTGEETAVRIHPDNFGCEGCFSSFCAAAFLCCGSVTDPEKEYMLEFVHSRHKLMDDFAELLIQQGFSPKRTLRRGANVLYFKASEQIEDMLTFMGAGHATLELIGSKAYKDMRNKANRITNCESANIDKTVLASHKTLEAIKALQRRGALEQLPPALQEAARLRSEYPELSLAELTQMCEGSVSKSGLSHRLRKLVSLAEQ